MATASRAARLCLRACRRTPTSTYRTIQRTPRHSSKPAFACPVQRAFSTTTRQHAAEQDDMDDEMVQWEDEEPLTNDDLITLRRIGKPVEGYTAKELADLHKVAHNEGLGDIEEYLERELDAAWKPDDLRKLEALDRTVIEPRPNRSSPLYDEEDDEVLGDVPFSEMDQDDMPDFAHAKAQEVKEMRHYARLAVWELPLLAKLAKPFEMPTKEQPLRWRYTTYFGEAHPAEKKVVVQFSPEDLPLTPAQVLKLKKLAGSRYNPEKELIKMSCESFEHPAQNKRYLSDLVDDLIAAAKDPKDMFEDVPLDTRHHKLDKKKKKQLRFPAEWRMTEGRQQQLAQHRERLLLEDAKKSETEEGLLDGQAVIEQHYVQMASQARAKEEREALPVGAMGKGKGSQRTMRAAR